MLKITALFLIILSLLQQVNCATSVEGYQEVDVNLQYGQYFKETVDANISEDGKVLYIEMDPKQEYVYFMFKCDILDAGQSASVQDYKIYFDIYYTQEQYDNAGFQTIYYLSELSTESYENDYKCYSQFIVYQLTYSNYYQQICETDGICTLVVYLQKQTNTVDYYFNFFDYYQQNGYMYQNTPTNIASYMEFGYDSINFSKIFAVQTSFPGFVLKFEFEYNQGLIQSLDNDIYEQNLVFIADQEIVDNIAVRIQGNDNPDKNYQIINQAAVDFDEMSLIQCNNCYIQISLYYGAALANSLTIKNYFTFQFPKNHNSQDDLFIPYTGGYSLTRIYFPQTISYAQIFQKKSQEYEINEAVNSYNNVILYPSGMDNIQNSLIDLKTTSRMFKGNFLQENLNTTYIYLFSMNNNKLNMPYGINYDSYINTYQYSDTLDIQYTETPFLFLYKAKSGSNQLSFNKAIQDSKIYVNYCDGDKINQCQLPNEKKYEKTFIQDENTNNQRLELDQRFSKDQYMIVLVDNDEFYKSSENNNDFSAGDLKLLSAFNQEMILRDKYMYESGTPYWVFVLVVEFVCAVLLFGCCNLQYYWKKNGFTKIIKQKISSYIQSCKK
ncbi:hypothetical protein PPERSA_08464 [Pseudocohnilembus persalinus]|uniref:Transmembrane protein n=1 Tax=Pseudocohnilembus persalinus TaxID=266149 RepID=A0A0V0R6C3_PSEPJ|nr:hypothetical protein PPERSA_08464 [Pseudocohnilembus persalinus]|eukprot:KRX10061.1 hypothetical protein PPERSA_08464 [Pseudocohnilembus persalinus]